LTHSGRLTHKVVTRQPWIRRRSGKVRRLQTDILTTEPRRHVHRLFYDGDFSAYLRALLREHPYVCNVIVISVFKALQKHQLATHDNYNYNFVIFEYTRPPYWTELNLLMSSVHFGRKPNRKRVCGSLNRTSQNHYGSEPNRTKPNQDRSKSRL